MRAAIFGVLLAATAALVVSALTRSGARAVAASPPPLSYHLAGAQSGRAVLLRLAATAARRSPPAAPAPDAYAYVKYAAWDLGTRVGDAGSSSRVIPVVTESWTRASGAGRVVTTRAGADRDEFTLPPGHALLRLSADPAILGHQLARGHPASLGPVERFVALTDLRLRQPIPSNVEAAILRLLAARTNPIDLGSVVDRAGRPGVAVSLDSAYSGGLTRYTFIFDPTTGGLLGDEQALLGNPGRLDVRRHAVLAYTVFLASGYVRSTT